jgi:hypothetical protein
MTRPIAVTKSARLLRKLSGADTKRQNHQSRALNEQEHAEDQRHGERCRHRRAEQQNTDQNVDRAENERADAAALEPANDLHGADDQSLNAEDND